MISHPNIGGYIFTERVFTVILNKNIIAYLKIIYVFSSKNIHKSIVRLFYFKNLKGLILICS